MLDAGLDASPDGMRLSSFFLMVDSLKTSARTPPSPPSPICPHATPTHARTYIVIVHLTLGWGGLWLIGPSPQLNQTLQQPGGLTFGLHEAPVRPRSAP